jgi:hypothetical protein
MFSYWYHSFKQFNLLLKMKKTLSISLILLLLFTSCSDGVSINSIKKIAPTIEVKDITSSNHTVSMTAIASWGNGCGSFSHYLVDKNEYDINITVYGEQPSNAICTDVMISFEAPINIVLADTGIYNFRFVQTDSTFLDTTFFVDF